MQVKRSFIDRCMDDDNHRDRIDEYIDRWHNSNVCITLHEFLGMTSDEYDMWVSDPAILRLIVVVRLINEARKDINEMSPHDVYYYSRASRKPFPLAEHIVAQDSYHALIYAADILRSRFHQAEPVLNSDRVYIRSYIRITIPLEHANYHLTTL